MTMATNQVLLSPAELAYLHSSLSLRPPIRPDGRLPSQFRPLTAETGILPGTNGSARVCFADGTEAIVGIKAEIEKSTVGQGSDDAATQPTERATGKPTKQQPRTRGDWLEMAVEIPGQRDDDPATVFLAEMLRESLLADGEFAKKLWINSRFHWRLYLDVRVSLLRLNDCCANMSQLPDPFDIFTIVIPATLAIPDDTSSTPRYTVTEAQV